MFRASLLIDTMFEFLFLVLLIGALLTWIPRMPVHKQPVKSLMIFTDIFFAPFRRIIPPLGGIDFSPILAFLFLGLVQKVIVEILIRFGL